MKKIFTLLITALTIWNLSAQLNMTYKSHVTYNESLNDIWGYAAPDNREYALVGLRNGVSIIDVTDTENPVLKGYANGPSTTWRDIKTWGDYAYVTNESGQGLLVINLGNLPNELTEDDYFYWAPTILSQPLSSIHNIFIDEFGIAYLAGSNVNNGGMIYVDVTNPGNPQYIGLGAAVYSHDVYVRNNMMYSSEIYEGHFAIYDVSDKSNTVLINTQQTGANFTHNTWLSDDGNTIFTTDETENAPVGAYDISNPNDIQELDQFRPVETLGDGVIPHNVHVWNDWIITSYYTDGCIILDGSRPDNLVEVGNFDTYIPASTGFNGAWGAYPFLPSGTVLVSDIGNGCYILEPNYVRACWLEGQVTDGCSGLPINDVRVDIISSQANLAYSEADGVFKTGQAISGTFDVVFSHPSYTSETVQATLVNGQVTTINVELGAASQSVGVNVVKASDGSPIENATIFINSDAISYEGNSDEFGNTSWDCILEGDYTIYAGAWGYKNNGMASSVSGGPSDLTIALEKGYADDFIVDLNWTVEGNAQTGAWERGEPVGTTSQGNPSNPDFDVDTDVGDFCYVTGNGGGGAGNDDVDNGYTQLTSPIMDLSAMNAPTLQFQYWFFNAGGGSDPNDALEIWVLNGASEVLLESITNSDASWTPSTVYSLADYIEITDQMQIRFYTSDQLNDDNGHLVEAAIDQFEVFDANPVSVDPVFKQNLTMSAFPNPFSKEVNVDYAIEDFKGEANLNVYNMLGQLVHSQVLFNESGILEINTLDATGLYFIRVEMKGKLSKAIKVVKQ